MNERKITEKQLQEFVQELFVNEKSRSTIQKYVHDIRCFAAYAEGKEIGKELVMTYKAQLGEKYAVSSANSMLAALNGFFRFAGWEDCCVRQFKQQKNVYLAKEKELTKAEYFRLVSTAEKSDNQRLSLLLQAICSCGIRVSELSYVTVEAVKAGKAEVSCKGKSRTIFFVKMLQKKLLDYARKQGIEQGSIFITKKGKPMDRSNIWREMKNLCEKAQVPPEKVFPHNLRHLFARIFYQIEKDIAKLADILGHSSINTTRIYIMTTGAEHLQKMESMRLVI